MSAMEQLQNAKLTANERHHFLGYIATIIDMHGAVTRTDWTKALLDTKEYHA